MSKIANSKIKFFCVILVTGLFLAGLQARRFTPVTTDDESISEISANSKTSKQDDTYYKWNTFYFGIPQHVSISLAHISAANVILRNIHTNYYSIIPSNSIRAPPISGAKNHFIKKIIV